jgi:hypothetical protein
LVFRGSHRWIPATGLVLGISAGVRLSSLLLPGPLFLLVLYRAPIRYKVSGLIVLSLAVAAWFVPMLRKRARLYPKWDWILADE